MSDALHAGAAALQSLVQRLANTCHPDWIETPDPERDPMDYRAVVDTLQADLQANLAHPSAEHRQGYLRALGYLLTVVGNGGAPSGAWDAIAATAADFEKRQGATQ